jgi:Phosphoenolpyruvate phosphomutase
MTPPDCAPILERPRVAGRPRRRDQRGRHPRCSWTGEAPRACPRPSASRITRAPCCASSDRPLWDAVRRALPVRYLKGEWAARGSPQDGRQPAGRFLSALLNVWVSPSGSPGTGVPRLVTSVSRRRSRPGWADRTVQTSSGDAANTSRMLRLNCRRLPNPEAKAMSAAVRSVSSRSDPSLPNAWDVGSAVVIAAAGAKAVATTSAGVAWALGVPDGAERLAAVVARIVAAVDVPVSAGIEAGYGNVAATAEAVVRPARPASTSRTALLASCSIRLSRPAVSPRPGLPPPARPAGRMSGSTPARTCFSPAPGNSVRP